MLSKAQANIIAEEIVNQASRSRLGKQKPPPANWLYRCKELSPLTPQHRSDVVRHAIDVVKKDLRLIFVQLAFIGTLAAFWLFVVAAASRDKYMPLFITSCWVVPMIFRTILVRREVRKIAKELQIGYGSRDTSQ